MSDVTERIERQIKNNPVLLYMKGSPDFPQCGFSAQTAEALKRCGVEFGYVNILEDEELRQGLKEYAQWPTYPQLWLNGELYGGCDIIVEAYNSGELQKAVKEAVGESEDSDG